MSTAYPAWDDPAWLEKNDTPWQRRLRRHQGRWRELELKQRPGPSARGDRDVASALPQDAALDLNLWTSEARDAYADALRALRDEKRPGLIQEDRLRRNLLSSQPLCFNLFGYLGKYPEALLPWVRTIDTAAESVLDVRLEWAPKSGTIGGSAFDAFVEYSRADGTGFLGVEVKYAEDLKASQTSPADDKWHEATVRLGGWSEGAAEALDTTGLRQFWFNTLLAQSVLDSGNYTTGTSVVMACKEDPSAAETVDSVASQLSDRQFLRFAAISDLVNPVQGHDTWRDMFTRRYLNFD